MSEVKIKDFSMDLGAEALEIMNFTSFLQALLVKFRSRVFQ